MNNNNNRSPNKPSQPDRRMPSDNIYRPNGVRPPTDQQPQYTQRPQPNTRPQNNVRPQNVRYPQNNGYGQSPQYRQPQSKRRPKQKKVSIALPVITMLIAAVIVGFAFDAVGRAVERAVHPRKFSEYVEASSAEHGVPEEIIYAVIKVESNFDPEAVSYRGAVGLMQLMPTTYEWLCSVRYDEYDESLLTDPQVNIDYGTYMLAYLYRQFGVWDNVYAAYNAGIGRVSGWLKDDRYSQNGHLTDIPIEETAKYVVKVDGAVEVYKRLYDQ